MDVNASMSMVAVSERARTIAGQTTPDRWAQLVFDAMERERILVEVKAAQQAGKSCRQSLRDVAPEVGWSQFRHWCRRYSTNGAPGWESLVDVRLPPQPVRIGLPVRNAACTLRHGNRAINCESARKALVAQFGEEGAVSDTSLRRIWAAANLSQPVGGNRQQGRRYDAGAALAFVAAAEVETQAAVGLGRAIQKAAAQTAQMQANQEVPPEPEGRDDKGRFTADYNRNLRAGLQPGEEDPRYRSDEFKRSRRALCEMRTLQLSAENLGAKLLAIAVTPLLTERHGFDGLEGPRGECLEILGVHPYMPSTLDKTLAEWAVLDVADAMWETHARQWVGNVQRWCEGMAPWQRLVVYVDGHQSPYWTRQYALSGKVSGVGRVMPCLSQIAVSAGASPPLLMCTLAGQSVLKTELVPVLRRLESIVGEGEVGRITVIDAEMGTAKTLSALMAMKPKRLFVTVLKGTHNRTVKFQPTGSSWQPYRDRDRLREGTVVLRGEGAPPEGLKLRAVEMQREGSRHPKPTIFMSNSVTDVDSDDHLSITEVPDVYLSRWPNQEGDFRNRNNGGGLDRSHGYGGEMVENVALGTALEKRRGRVKRAEAKLAAAELTLLQFTEPEEDNKKAPVPDKTTTSACQPAEGAKRATEKSLKKEDNKKGRVRDKNVTRARQLATAAKKAAEKSLEKARKELQAAETTPKTIFKRGTIRDSIATVAVLTMAMLVEFVLKEYFGGVNMELRTYIERFVNLAVTVVTSRHTVLYQIHANARDPQGTELLRRVCAEITRRRLTRDDKILVYEVVDPPGQ